MALKFDQQITSIRGVQPETLIAMQIASDVISEQEGKDTIITSVRRFGDAIGAGYHGTGHAFDMRSKHLSNPKKVVDALKARLGFLGYDIVLEEDHIHVEFDVKKAEGREVDAEQ